VSKFDEMMNTSGFVFAGGLEVNLKILSKPFDLKLNFFS
jgi:hypothetical protein